MAPARSQRLLPCLLCLALQGRAEPPEAQLPECPPEPFEAPRSEQKGPNQFNLVFANQAGAAVDVFWCNQMGKEVGVATLHDGRPATLDSLFDGQVLHVRSRRTKRLVMGHRVNATGEPYEVVVPHCAGMENADAAALALDESRWPEFEKLAAAAQGPCVGPSSEWGCVRRVPPEEVSARDPSKYGFAAEEVTVEGFPYEVGTTTDHRHDDQIGYMPNFTSFEQGYLRMQMTDRMRELIPFYHENKAHMHKASLVPGFFTNNHIVEMSMLGIDPRVRMEVAEEMQQVLEWWTKTKLRHSTTFGVRIYKRGAVLVNHVDRKDTHVASAILQVHQVCDEDGGWPVEVIHPLRAGVTEVYLQPGEMLLYEGARLQHGRPMRFQGEEFANVFSHFLPSDFPGPDERWRNPHLVQREEKEKHEL